MKQRIREAADEGKLSTLVLMVIQNRMELARHDVSFIIKISIYLFSPFVVEWSVEYELFFVCVCILIATCFLL